MLAEPKSYSEKLRTLFSLAATAREYVKLKDVWHDVIASPYINFGIDYEKYKAGKIDAEIIAASDAISAGDSSVPSVVALFIAKSLFSIQKTIARNESESDDSARAKLEDAIDKSERTLEIVIDQLKQTIQDKKDLADENFQLSKFTEKGEKFEGEEEPGAVLGKFEFANDRIKGRHRPAEPNTKIERELSLDIDSYFDDNAPLPAKDITLLRKLLASGMYSDIIKPTSAKEIFRGMIVSADWMLDVLRAASKGKDEGQGPNCSRRNFER